MVCAADGTSVIHRVDYHKVLLEEARRLGAVIQLDSEVTAVDFDQTAVVLASQERIHADVIIGADGTFPVCPPAIRLTDTGIRLVVRDHVLGYHRPPVETGDLAYRATIPRSWVEALDPFLQDSALRAWIGPRQHAILYPVRNKTVFNLVLSLVSPVSLLGGADEFG
ncbi:hypothetical protein VTN77DRAFT_5619 [Rasamsonia byssochlamydoides]|uniref:uncharacterized protein n=1 Tax=Rasamsonia byssochlamydoides TaxID=89139 RepID=UPI003742FD36